MLIIVIWLLMESAFSLDIMQICRGMTFEKVFSKVYGHSLGTLA